jgi:hypothetical protein
MKAIFPIMVLVFVILGVPAIIASILYVICQQRNKLMNLDKIKDDYNKVRTKNESLMAYFIGVFKEEYHFKINEIDFLSDDMNPHLMLMRYSFHQKDGDEQYKIGITFDKEKELEAVDIFKIPVSKVGYE